MIKGHIASFHRGHLEYQLSENEDSKTGIKYYICVIDRDRVVPKIFKTNRVCICTMAMCDFGKWDYSMHEKQHPKHVFAVKIFHRYLKLKKYYENH